MLILFVLFALLVFTPFTSKGQASRAYEVVITGIEDPGLVDSMEQISDTFALRDRPLPGVSLLRKRTEEDRALFLKWLKAEGYYGAEVTVKINPDAVPVQVTFRIEIGPPFLLKSVTLEAPKPEIELPDGKELGLELDGPFRTADLLDAENALLRRLRSRGFPFPEITNRRVVVDHATRSVSVTLEVESGPLATFGPTEIVGLESVEEAFVFNLIPWKEGDPFDGELLEKTQRRLVASKVFSTARISTDQRLDEDGSLPVTITVTEGEHRTFGIGVSYKTDEGPGVGISWEHRNFLNRGEQLRFAAAYSDYTVTGEAGFLKPFFLRKDQTLRLSAKLAEDSPDAYTSRYAKTGVGVRRDLSDTLWLGGGIDYKASRVTQLGATEHYTYFSFPFGLELDRSDALLDPARGYRVGVNAVLYEDPFDSDPAFVKGSLRLRGYAQVLQTPFLVLAAAVNGGGLAGGDRDEIPADERFYAGGGGSIRGYAYQSVGPRREGAPVGGRSLVEASLEGRLKLTDRFGLVMFVDGGNAFESRVPDFSESLLWGAGAGIRYYTPIGPFRFNIAFPLDRREGIDDRFQIYISVGQAF
jgi:translocation and assembly module TamA